MQALLSIRATAQILNLSVPTVTRLYDAGILPGILIAQRRRRRIIKFRPEALEKFVAKREKSRPEV
jgi:hypothetical protein